MVGVLCLWGPIYTVGFFTLIVISATRKGGLAVPFEVVAAFHVFTILVLGLLLAICMRDAYSNPLIPDGKRAFWAVILILGNIIALPIYWWRYVRPRMEPRARQVVNGTG
jgi:hypothetical protein